jgi:hypothetical protein|tara:strand:- start:1120 stop:1533 length:414 start_codon:yes stop_codon:yes gene_type:complete
MAFAGYGDRASSLGTQTREYGYGLSDIQRAKERIGRSDAMNQFNVEQQAGRAARTLPGAFNRRGMIDSGQFRRAQEIQAGETELARFGAAAQGEEARRQLDQQRNLLEEQLYGSMIEDQIANALRRFAVAQTVGGLA